MSLPAIVEAAVDQAVAVADAVDANAYPTRRQVESAVGDARATILAAIVAVLAEHPLAGAPLVRALRLLAGRLLDLDLSAARATRAVTLISERSVVDLALELYADGLRADEILALNPSIRRPWAMPIGTTLEVYVE